MLSHQDALGHEIVLGDRYGYTQNSNGYTTIVKGIAGKLNNETYNVTLIDVEIKRLLYASSKRDNKHIEPFVKVKNRSVNCFILFRI